MVNNQILVIGGAGYIGSHVVLEFLSKGYQVTVLDNLSSGREENLFPNVEFIHGDIQDRNLLTKVFQTYYDGVVHLAALKAAGESMFIPETYSHQNITGTLNILEAMVQSKTRNFIFSSTAAVYGPPQYLPMDEKHPVEPINFYGFTKLEIEHFLKWFDQLKGIKFAALRYFNAAGYDVQGRVQGLEKQPANLIPVVMETASGFRQSMQIFGNDYETKDGSGVRDYVHVSDLANAHVLAFEHLNIKKESTT
ncbi:MAG: UDP-glucose 4-epimerase, partial [bacterium]